MPEVPSLILLAGDRGGEDPLARHHDVASKVLVPIAGEPVMLRVMDALNGMSFRDKLLVGPHRATLSAAPHLEQAIEDGGWHWLSPSMSPASSVVKALDALEGAGSVLVTTADHALLTERLAEEFLAKAADSDAALTIGFVRHADVVRQFPEGQRTGWSFADDRYCTCNLFYFARPEARAVARLWRRIEDERKRPWKVVGLLGLGALLRFAARRLTLQQALTLLGEKSGATIAPILLSDPSAAVDVDSVADWRLVERAVTVE